MQAVLLPSSSDAGLPRYIEPAPPSNDWTPQQLQQLLAQAEYESGHASTIHPSDEDLQLAPLLAPLASHHHLSDYHRYKHGEQGASAQYCPLSISLPAHIALLREKQAAFLSQNGIEILLASSSAASPASLSVPVSFPQDIQSPRSAEDETPLTPHAESLQQLSLPGAPKHISPSTTSPSPAQTCVPGSRPIPTVEPPLSSTLSDDLDNALSSSLGHRSPTPPVATASSLSSSWATNFVVPSTPLTKPLFEHRNSNTNSNIEKGNPPPAVQTPKTSETHPINVAMIIPPDVIDVLSSTLEYNPSFTQIRHSPNIPKSSTPSSPTPFPSTLMSTVFTLKGSRPPPSSLSSSTLGVDDHSLPLTLDRLVLSPTSVPSSVPAASRHEHGVRNGNGSLDHKYQRHQHGNHSREVDDRGRSTPASSPSREKERGAMHMHVPSLFVVPSSPNASPSPASTTTQNSNPNKRHHPQKHHQQRSVSFAPVTKVYRRPAAAEEIALDSGSTPYPPRVPFVSFSKSSSSSSSGPRSYSSVVARGSTTTTVTIENNTPSSTYTPNAATCSSPALLSSYSRPPPVPSSSHSQSSPDLGLGSKLHHGSVSWAPEAHVPAFRPASAPAEAGDGGKPQIPLPAPTMTLGNMILSSCPGKKVRLSSPSKTPTSRSAINRDLHTDLARIRSLGVSLIINCLSDEELSFLGSPWPLYASTASSLGLDVLRIPMPEGLTPLSITHMDEMLERVVREYTAQGKAVLAHCRGGVGRAGLIACCWMLKLGVCGSLSVSESGRWSGDGVGVGGEGMMEEGRCGVRRDTLALVQSAIRVVRARRSLKAIETYEQVKFLVDYVEYLRSPRTEPLASSTPPAMYTGSDTPDASAL